MTMDITLQEMIEDFSGDLYDPREFIPGKTRIGAAGQVLGREDIFNLVNCALGGYYNEGKYADAYRKRLRSYTHRNHVTLCNSGSSANLLAVSALQEFYGTVGKKIVTCATGFPTTVNPILQTGSDILFVDADRKTLNACMWQVMGALERTDVGGVILAHTLGFPFNEEPIARRCQELGKWFIADTCDALGATWNARRVGSLSDINTLSTYPAHHLSTGEGGVVFTDNGKLHKLIDSYCNWGRGCVCPAGKDNTCGKRFNQSVPGLPEGWDHKYIYERVGYNLKMTDLQAALGLGQLDKLEDFIQKRRDHFAYLRYNLSHFLDRIDFVEVPPLASPSPFGFPIICKNVSRKRFIAHLESKNIATRMVFGGNLTRQPAYARIPERWEVLRPLDDADYLMHNAFWINCSPGLTLEMLDYMLESISKFLEVA